MSSTNHYALTMRFLDHMPLASEYDDLIKKVKEAMPHLDIRYHLEIVYKLNGNHNIHLHGMIKTDKYLSYKKLRNLCPEKFHMFIEPIRSKSAWNTYITKEDQRSVRDAIIKAHINRLDSNPQL